MDWRQYYTCQAIGYVTRCVSSSLPNPERDLLPQRLTMYRLEDGRLCTQLDVLGTLILEITQTINIKNGKSNKCRKTFIYFDLC